MAAATQAMSSAPPSQQQYPAVDGQSQQTGADETQYATISSAIQKLSLAKTTSTSVLVENSSPSKPAEAEHTSEKMPSPRVRSFVSTSRSRSTRQSVIFTQIARTIHLGRITLAEDILDVIEVFLVPGNVAHPVLSKLFDVLLPEVQLLFEVLHLERPDSYELRCKAFRIFEEIVKNVSHQNLHWIQDAALKSGALLQQLKLCLVTRLPVLEDVQGMSLDQYQNNARLMLQNQQRMSRAFVTLMCSNQHEGNYSCLLRAIPKREQLRWGEVLVPVSPNSNNNASGKQYTVSNSRNQPGSQQPAYAVTFSVDQLLYKMLTDVTTPKLIWNDQARAEIINQLYNEVEYIRQMRGVNPSYEWTPLADFAARLDKLDAYELMAGHFYLEPLLDYLDHAASFRDSDYVAYVCYQALQTNCVQASNLSLALALHFQVIPNTFQMLNSDLFDCLLTHYNEPDVVCKVLIAMNKVLDRFGDVPFTHLAHIKWMLDNAKDEWLEFLLLFIHNLLYTDGYRATYFIEMRGVESILKKIAEIHKLSDGPAPSSDRRSPGTNRIMAVDHLLSIFEIIITHPHTRRMIALDLTSVYYIVQLLLLPGRTQRIIDHVVAVVSYLVSSEPLAYCQLYKTGVFSMILREPYMSSYMAHFLYLYHRVYAAPLPPVAGAQSSLPVSFLELFLPSSMIELLDQEQQGSKLFMQVFNSEAVSPYYIWNSKTRYLVLDRVHRDLQDFTEQHKANCLLKFYESFEMPTKIVFPIEDDDEMVIDRIFIKNYALRSKDMHVLSPESFLTALVMSMRRTLKRRRRIFYIRAQCELYKYQFYPISAFTRYQGLPFLLDVLEDEFEAIRKLGGKQATSPQITATPSEQEQSTSEEAMLVAEADQYKQVSLDSAYQSLSSEDSMMTRLELINAALELIAVMFELPDDFSNYNKLLFLGLNNSLYHLCQITRFFALSEDVCFEPYELVDGASSQSPIAELKLSILINILRIMASFCMNQDIDDVMKTYTPGLLFDIALCFSCSSTRVNQDPANMKPIPRLLMSTDISIRALQLLYTLLVQFPSMHQDVVNSGAILCLILTGVLRDGLMYVIGPDYVPQLETATAASSSQYQSYQYVHPTWYQYQPVAHMALKILKYLSKYTADEKLLRVLKGFLRPMLFAELQTGELSSPKNFYKLLLEQWPSLDNPADDVKLQLESFIRTYVDQILVETANGATSQWDPDRALNAFKGPALTKASASFVSASAAPVLAASGRASFASGTAHAYLPSFAYLQYLYQYQTYNRPESPSGNALLYIQIY